MAYHYIPKIVYNAITINMDFPPKGDPFGERIKSNGNITESKSGIQQTVVDYLEKENEITLSFLPESKKTALETFLINWALLGKEFDYYFDKDDALTKITVTLEKSSFTSGFKVICRKGNGFLYELKLKFRRVI